MRFYSISLTPPNTQPPSTAQQSTVANIPTVITPTFSPSFGFANLASGNAGGGPTWASFLNGAVLPAAWDIELDIPLGSVASTEGGSAFVRIWGISLEEIAQATQLQANTQASPQTPGYNIQVMGGMGFGLPLATSEVSQQGVLAQGQVLQSFGNWIGTDMTLDIYFNPFTGSPASPQNYTLYWPAGMPLSTAIRTTLQTALSGQSALSTPPTINISSNLVQQADGSFTVPDLSTFASMVRQASLRIMNSPTYQGVNVNPAGGSFIVSDGSVQGSSSPYQLQFQDFIGQPTWIGYNIIQIKTVMRGDLQIGSQITMPPGVLVTSVSLGAPSLNDGSVFQGTFNITGLRHIGRFRQADAASWVTVINAAAVPGSATFSPQGSNPIQGQY